MSFCASLNIYYSLHPIQCRYVGESGGIFVTKIPRDICNNKISTLPCIYIYKSFNEFIKDKWYLIRFRLSSFFVTCKCLAGSINMIIIILMPMKDNKKYNPLLPQELLFYNVSLGFVLICKSVICVSRNLDLI